MLDQPTNGLDQPGRRALFVALQSSPATRIVLTRDRELLGLADRLLVFENGRLTPARMGGAAPGAAIARAGAP